MEIAEKFAFIQRENKLLQELSRTSKYLLKDLFRIRDALQILAHYDLEDKDLLTEVNKFIEQERTK